jgi:NAD(P)-dependent dehydrogenase (short-subunit alcohol dehydrogenase family)
MTALVKEVVLVTGGMHKVPTHPTCFSTNTIPANSGIGFEIARQFLARGTYHVFLGARSAERGTAALQDLQSRKLPGIIEFLPMDVQSDANIADAVSKITKDHGRLDILVNNAGVANPDGATERERLAAAFDINATGPYLLAKAMIPLLRKAQNPRIINISSGAGSIGRRLFPESPMYNINGVPYRASKVALNMMTMCLRVEHDLGVEQTDEEKLGEGEEKKTIKVFAYDPGFTQSNLSSYNKKEFGARSAEETVNSIMDVVDGKRDGEGGTFIHNTGHYPW